MEQRSSTIHLHWTSYSSSERIDIFDFPLHNAFLCVLILIIVDVFIRSDSYSESSSDCIQFVLSSGTASRLGRRISFYFFVIMIYGF